MNDIEKEKIHVVPGEQICIGRRGEHLARQVQFDLKAWVESYGEGRAELLYQRPGDTLPYPIPAQRQGDLLLWDITRTDTAKAGRNGRAEIRWYIGEQLVILENSYVQVEQTLENPGEVPDPPGVSWFEQVLAQVRRVEAPVTSPPILNEETGTWMVYDREQESYVDTGFPATGPRGADGKDGAPGRDGRDGIDGQPGAPGRDGIDGQDGAPGRDGMDGQDGAPGRDGADGQPGKDGPQGPRGERGQRGTGILKVTSAPASYTTTTGGKSPIKRMALSTICAQADVDEVLVGDLIAYSYYQYHVYYIDGTYAYMDSYQSVRGATGATGAQGPRGEQGEPGASVQGEPGRDGYTPVKGVDYFTEADKAEMIAAVMDGIGCPVFGVVDADNHIILTGSLAEETYYLRYEMEDGTTVDIGTLSLEETVKIINQIPISTDANGNPFNGGQGWKTGYRISGSSGSESAQTGTEVTGYIPFRYGDAFYIRNIVDDGSHVVGFYDSNYAMVATVAMNQLFSSEINGTVQKSCKVDRSLNTNLMDKDEVIAFMRLSAGEITASSVISINQPIT